jgi:DNA polymerase III epsilon subunit-like protein
MKTKTHTSIDQGTLLRLHAYYYQYRFGFDHLTLLDGEKRVARASTEAYNKRNPAYAKNETKYTDSKTGPSYDHNRKGRYKGAAEHEFDWGKQASAREAGLKIPRINFYYWEYATGIGVRIEDTPYICLDLDGCKSDSHFYYFLTSIGLPEDYEWLIKSGSRQGYHIWVEIDDTFPRNTFFDSHRHGVFAPNKQYRDRFDKIEIRLAGHMVLPPSIHQSGAQYEFVNVEIPTNNPLKISGSNLIAEVERRSVDSSSIYKSNREDFLKSEVVLNSVYEGRDHFLFLDFETSGLPKQWDRPHDDTDNWPHVVQAAWVFGVDESSNDLGGWDAIREEVSMILQPDDFEFDSKATSVHGISKEKMKTEGVDRKLLFERLAGLINSAKYIIAHNTDFDISVLKCELKRHDIEAPLWWDKKVICTMKSTTEYCGIRNEHGLKWPTLEELHNHVFNESFSGAHDALEDVKALYRCFWKLEKDGVSLIKGEI